jgi:hypothetical protein
MQEIWLITVEENNLCRDVFDPRRYEIVPKVTYPKGRIFEIKNLPDKGNYSNNAEQIKSLLNVFSEFKDVEINDVSHLIRR